MKKTFLVITAGFLSLLSFSQDINKIINAAEVSRIEKILSSDEMQGRKTFTPGIDKAANFIAGEFAKANLKFFADGNSYFQEITMVKATPLEISGSLDTETLNTGNVAANTTAAELHITSLRDYEVITVKKDDDFNKTVFPLFDMDKNLLILVDTAHASRFKRMQRFAGNAKFASTISQVFILTANLNPASVQLHIKNELTEQNLKNVVGVIPGRSKKDEYVVFGGHYDHLGIGKPDEKGDSIYNGANDDAAGTTAVMMLAKYFSRLNNNERTLIFVAFTAEEIGGYGSRYFSKQLDPEKVIALFNIEMIGTESKWGTNSAYITGYEKSNMGKILQANLKGSKFKFEPDPYPKQNLFYRSDNATLAALGVPAHTISTSKMEQPPNNEPNYHKQSDEIGTLDLNNMAEIIKAIAISSKTIVSGKDTPTRVEKEK